MHCYGRFCPSILATIVTQRTIALDTNGQPAERFFPFLSFLFSLVLSDWPDLDCGARRSAGRRRDSESLGAGLCVSGPPGRQSAGRSLPSQWGVAVRPTGDARPIAIARLRGVAGWAASPTIRSKQTCQRCLLEAQTDKAPATTLGACYHSYCHHYHCHCHCHCRCCCCCCCWRSLCTSHQSISIPHGDRGRRDRGIN